MKKVFLMILALPLVVFAQPQSEAAKRLPAIVADPIVQATLKAVEAKFSLTCAATAENLALGKMTGMAREFLLTVTCRTKGTLGSVEISVSGAHISLTPAIVHIQSISFVNNEI